MSDIDINNIKNIVSKKPGDQGYWSTRKEIFAYIKKLKKLYSELEVYPLEKGSCPVGYPLYDYYNLFVGLIKQSPVDQVIHDLRLEHLYEASVGNVLHQPNTTLDDIVEKVVNSDVRVSQIYEQYISDINNCILSHSHIAELDEYETKNLIGRFVLKTGLLELLAGTSAINHSCAQAVYEAREELYGCEYEHY